MENPVTAFTKIVVGVDLSASSLVAVDQAMSVARRSGAALVMMLVGPVTDAADGVPSAMQEAATRMYHLLLDRFASERAQLEALRQRLVGQGVEISHAMAHGFPDSGLVDHATLIGADLIAVGTHGRTGLRRLLLGSVAEKTVQLATSSVLVARGEPTVAEGGFHRVVVGTDFSALADVALARAVDVAAPGATIEVVHAWHIPPDFSMDGSMAVTLAALRESLVADAARAGRELCAQWKARGVELVFSSVEGPERVALCDRATATGADLIVVGSHGRHGLRRVVLGSVAEATVRHAPCSVLVARP